MELQIVAKTDVGVVRDHNEDNYLVNPDLKKTDWYFENGILYHPDGELGSLLVVADGMGGMNAGEVASMIAIEAVKEYFGELGRVPLEEVPIVLDKVFQVVNTKIVQHSKQYPETGGMGTTLIIAWLRDEAVHLAWVGDSRAYLLREGESIRKISKDHSLVQQWIDQGKLDDEQAFYHPQNNILTQSLGDPNRIPKAGYERHNLRPGDKILLCSDGLNGMLHDKEIQSVIIRHSHSIKAASEHLVQAALTAGGDDNITLILAHFHQANGMINSIPTTHTQLEPIRETGMLKKLFYGSLTLVLISGLILALFFYFQPPQKLTSLKRRRHQILQ